jgi:uncharacterized membrane protein YozB (DUF420 family)
MTGTAPAANGIALAQHGRKGRFFFVGMASAVIVTVFAGFAPTFYLRGSFPQDRPMSVLLHIHGIVFSAWIIMFLVQSLLIARGSRRLHQRLGWIATGIAATMIVLVIAAVIEQLRRVNGFPPPPLAVALSAFDIVVFAILVGAAIYYRRRPDWHKRFMLSATILLLGAPLFRIVLGFIAGGEIENVGILPNLLLDAFLLPCLAYDLLTLRKIHPAYLYALPLMALDQLAQTFAVSWVPFIHFSYALQRLVA